MGSGAPRAQQMRCGSHAGRAHDRRRRRPPRGAGLVPGDEAEFDAARRPDYCAGRPRRSRHGGCSVRPELSSFADGCHIDGRAGRAAAESDAIRTLWAWPDWSRAGSDGTFGNRSTTRAANTGSCTRARHAAAPRRGARTLPGRPGRSGGSAKSKPSRARTTGAQSPASCPASGWTTRSSEHRGRRSVCGRRERSLARIPA